MSKQHIGIYDADIFVFKVAKAAERKITLDGEEVIVADLAEAKAALSNWFAHVKQKINLDEFRLAFTGKKNYRKDIWPEYKMHRQTEKPLLMKELVDWCNKEYCCLTEPSLEADDILGEHMSASYIHSNECQYIGVSEDKDLLGVPGAIFNPAKDALVQYTTLQDAIMFFYVQVLMGDTSDGYKGVPGVGPVKAWKYMGKALEESEGCYEFITKGWDAILHVYAQNGLDNEVAYENASMAKILWYGEEPKHFSHKNLQKYWRLKNGK